MDCRGCGSDYLWPFLDLGNLAIPRFPSKPDEQVPHFPLALVKCEACHLVQLSESVDRDLLFTQFWYRSGISQTIRENLKDIAREARQQASLVAGDTVLDIGSNDGTLLRFFTDSLEYQESQFNLVGFEPAENVIEDSNGWATIINDYFSAEQWKERFGSVKAKLITAIGMFYDLENPLGFCQNVKQCLADDGAFIVQQNYLGTMLANTGYDNICHEHLTYFSLLSIEPILEKAGLEIYDVVLNTVNGGSFKTFIAHKGKRKVSERVSTLREVEARQNLVGRKPYRDFSYRVRASAREVNKFLMDKSNVMIYGAGTRGSTLFQYASRFNHPTIRGAVDNNPEKHGRYYLDTKIPIMSREEALKNPPEYFLVLPYHLAEEIEAKERANFPSRTKWIVPLPEFRIV